MIQKKILSWRAAKRKGSIMKPETFGKIVAAAKKRGYRNPQAVAGKVYWSRVREKYKESK